MNVSFSFDLVRRLLASNATDEVIELLRHHLATSSGDLYRECLGHAGRLAHLRQRARRGDLSAEQEAVEHNRLRAALLEFVDQLAGAAGQQANGAAADVPAPEPRSQGGDDGGPASRTANAAAPVEPTDILLVTVLPEEYAAVLRLLTDARPVQGGSDAPNLYGWRVGTLPRQHGGAYRVAVAFAGRAGNVNASQAVVRSAERWRPRYVLLIGIAGGLPREGCVVGDVVISTEIYGYEYGKVDGGFQPRANWTYQVDRGLLNSAQAFAAVTPDWWTGAAPPPKVLFGSVASGEKVVDDPSEPFFAAVLNQWPKLQAVEMEGAGAVAAIDELHAAGREAVGFLMVRGISDMPRPLAERAAEAGRPGERDGNKKRACDVAARFAVSWIGAEWPVEPRRIG